MLNLRTGKNDLAPVALTRRDSIKGLAAILAAGCAPAIASAAARGAGGRVRGAAAAAAAVYRTAKSYVQNGLIAMWDGIENAGWGTHDASATIWKDLVGSRDFTYATGAIILSDCVLCGSEGAASSSEDSGFNPAYCEIVIDCNTSLTTVNRCLFAFCHSSDGSGVVNTFGILSNGRGVCCTKTPNVTTPMYQTSNSGKFSLQTEINSGFVTQNTRSVISSGTNWFNGIVKVFKIGTNAMNTYPFTNGKIFTLRCYSSKPSAAEIAANYAVDKARFGLT